MPTHINGIHVEDLQQTVQQLKSDPELGRCRFRVKNRWVGANRNVNRIEDFYGAKQEMHHQQPFEIAVDEPPILAGEDSAPNPVEVLLAALASCLTTAMVAHAAVRGIEIDELESEIEGDIDLNGYMGLSRDTPRGYQDIRVKFHVESDASTEQLKSLAEFSPVFNTLIHGTKVDLSVHKKPAAKETREVEQRAPGV